MNPTARAGFNAQTVVNYERGRPEFDSAHVERVLDVLLPRAERPGDIVEVGAGSGKFTRPLCFALRKRFGLASPSLTCVEPEGMAERLQDLGYPIRLLRTTADAMGDIASETAAAVICANSFHWFADTPSVNEIQRILRPGGRLGIILFGGWQDDPFWHEAISAIVAPYLDGSAPHLVNNGVAGGTQLVFANGWRDLFAKRRDFTPLAHEKLMTSWSFDAETMVAYVHSFSMIAKQPAEIRDKVADEVRAALRRAEAESRSQVVDGTRKFAVPMSLHLLSTQRTP